MKRLCMIAAGAALGSMAHAITFSASQGTFAAQVDFTINGSNLQVVLTNTSTFDTMVPGDVLSGVFFDGTPALTPLSAVVSAGSSVYNNTTLVHGAGTDIGGAWAYKSGINPNVSGATQGIGSAGFNVFGPPNVFPGNNADGDPGVDGVSYGLLSAGDNLNTGNGGISGRDLTKNSTTFLLSGIPQGFDLNLITKVSFQYGTDLSETRLVTPEPCTMIALAGAGFMALKRRKRSS